MKNKKIFIIILIGIIFLLPLSKAQNIPFDELVYTCSEYAYPKMTYTTGEVRIDERKWDFSLVFPGKIGVPINLIWKNAESEFEVGTVILNQGWTIFVNEWIEYVIDPWTKTPIEDVAVAETTNRLEGGYHVLLFKLSNGEVVANAHHDKPPVRAEINGFPIKFAHEADEFEYWAEKKSS
jgi:hypothetical protein